MIATMETDPICRAFDLIERECREYRRRIAARPLFRSVTPKGGRPKGESDRAGKSAKWMKAKRAQCIEKGICTICQKADATEGRLCAERYKKQRERMKKRIAERSQRRAACRNRRVA